jgi:hypothetical protein
MRRNAHSSHRTSLSRSLLPAAIGVSGLLVAGITAVAARAEDVAFRGPSFARSFAPIADGLTPLKEWGHELATDGTRVIVGVRSGTAPFGFLFANGAAEIWEFDDAPTSRGWRRAADLLSPDGFVTNDHFGLAVDIDGDRAAVGAPRRTVNGVSNAGAVYVYRRNADGTWSHAQTLTSATPASAEFFGSAVALDDGVLVVGVPGRAGGGGATLFTADAQGTYGPGVPFAVPGSVSSGDWGEVLALDGGVVLVGDTQAKVGTVNAVGALASYVLNGTEAPTFESFLTPPPSDVVAGALFGAYLDADDGRLAVASPAVNEGRGAVSLFKRSRGAWVAGPVLQGDASLSRLGRVSVNGDLLAVGSNWELVSPPPGRSRLYQIGETSVTLLATEIGAFESSTFGSDVALLDGWWLVRESGANGLEDSIRIRAQRLGDVGGDCNGDGVANAIEVANGADDCNDDLVPSSCELAADDCDGNGVPDACQAATIVLDSTTNPPDGVAVYNFNAPLGVFLARIDAPANAAALLAIGSEVFVSGATSDVTSYAAVYVDPTGAPAGAAPPSDLTLLGAWETRFTMSSERFEIATDVIPVEPGGVYYVAFVTEPASLTTSPLFRTRGEPYVPGYSFFGTTETSTFDPVAIGKTTAFTEFDDSLQFGLNLVAFARFATTDDADADGTPDVCACNGDFDGDGGVSASDLGVLLGAWGTPTADLDGDGTTDPTDLAILLGAWGPCAGG